MASEPVRGGERPRDPASGVRSARSASSIDEVATARGRGVPLRRETGRGTPGRVHRLPRGGVMARAGRGTMARGVTGGETRKHRHLPRHGGSQAFCAAGRIGLGVSVALLVAFVFAVGTSAAQTLPLSPAARSSRSTITSEPNPTSAPLNPAFTAYLRSRATARTAHNHAGLAKQSLGLMPSPIDFSSTRWAGRAAKAMAARPPGLPTTSPPATATNWPLSASTPPNPARPTPSTPAPTPRRR